MRCWNWKHRRRRGGVHSNHHFPFSSFSFSLMVTNYWDCRSVCIPGLLCNTTVHGAAIACSTFLFLAALIWSANETSGRIFSFFMSSTSNFSKAEIRNCDATMFLRLATWAFVKVFLSSFRKRKKTCHNTKTVDCEALKNRSNILVKKVPFILKARKSGTVSDHGFRIQA